MYTLPILFAVRTLTIRLGTADNRYQAANLPYLRVTVCVTTDLRNSDSP